MEWLALHQFTLMGLFFMLVIGPAVGNYACSVVYRLPLGKTPFERHPFCGHCNADLKPIDLFPIISWLMTRGKCRYCGGIIPPLYTVIEVACLVIFSTYFLHFGIGEQFLLYAAYATFVVILAAIHWQQGWISATIYSYAMLMIALARVLAEHTIYGVIQSSVVMLVLVLLMWRIAGSLSSRRIPGFPCNGTDSDKAETPAFAGMTAFQKPWIWWFVLMGSVLPMQYWYYIAPVYFMKLLVPKQARVIVYAAGALALPLIL